LNPSFFQRAEWFFGFPLVLEHLGIALSMQRRVREVNKPIKAFISFLDSDACRMFQPSTLSIIAMNTEGFPRTRNRPKPVTRFRRLLSAVSAKMLDVVSIDVASRERLRGNR